jgi:hypothetical protein
MTTIRPGRFWARAGMGTAPRRAREMADRDGRDSARPGPALPSG